MLMPVNCVSSWTERRRDPAHRRGVSQRWEGPKDKVPVCDFSRGAGRVGWPIISLLWSVFDFSSWITPGLLILWLCEQQLVLGGEWDQMARGGEGEAAAKKTSATRVRGVKAPPERLSETSSVFALLRSH